jgi:hypothetical protein
MANSGRKPEVHRGIIYDVMSDSNVPGFVVQTGILSLPLTDVQAKTMLQLLAGEFARDEYDSMTPAERAARWLGVSIGGALLHG